MDVPIYTIGDEDCSNEIAIEFYLTSKIMVKFVMI